jgi:hypothetical protein
MRGRRSAASPDLDTFALHLVDFKFPEREHALTDDVVHTCGDVWEGSASAGRSG